MILRWLKTGYLVAALTAVNVGAWAETMSKVVIPAPVIMVVDTQGVVQHSLAGQAIRQQHDKYLQSYEAEIQATRKELSETEAFLTKEKVTMPFAEWQSKAQAFDQRLTSFNQKYSQINQAVEKSYIAAMNDLGRAVTQITSEVASEYGANLVLPTQQVMLHDPRMNLTKVVIERMDSKFPSITFPVPDVPVTEGANKGPGPTGKK